MALTKVQKTGITDNAIDADKIEDGTIVAADIAPGTITNDKLAGSIANDKLANSSITVNGTSVSLGGSVSAGKVEWQAVKTADFNAVAGEGYFVDTDSVGAVTATLPGSPSAGDTIAFKDYAGTFGTNNLTIARNGNNIQGVANDSLISTNRASIVLVYIDATKGWLYTNESNVNFLGPTFISATGGTITTSGDYKIHTFTGDGTFVVSSIGDCVGSPAPNKNNISYMVVAGGGGGGYYYGSAGGAGGFREYKGALDSYTASPLDGNPGGTSITVTATTYPITVGSGGAAAGASPSGGPGVNGSNSVFSTVTSAGGGAGNGSTGSGTNGSSGGSGGGGSGGLPGGSGTGGSGNTPPTSPSQGNPGSSVSGQLGGGGGGAGSAGEASGTDGGDGVGTEINPSACVGTPGPVGPLRYFAGGGGGGAAGPHPEGAGVGGVGGGGNNETAGTANTGGGGGSDATPGPAKPGGKGIVIIRYKFQ